MPQKVSELLEEFEALTESIAGTEKPEQSDRTAAVALWGKLVAKLNAGPIATKLQCAIASDPSAEELSDAKRADSVIAQFDRCIAFLEKYLSETEPSRQTIATIDPLAIKSIMSAIANKEDSAKVEGDAPKKPRTRRSKESSADDQSAEATTAGKDLDEQGAVADSASDSSDAEDAPEEKPVKPKSSFQKTLEAARGE